MNNHIPYFVSWSGGKDSCLALYRAIKKYGKPQYLLTMLTEDGYRSRSHGLTKTILQQQARILQIPIHFCATTWDDYERNFIASIKYFKEQGIKLGVFGDIKIPNCPEWDKHRLWADNLCNSQGISADEPLWEDEVGDLAQELFTLGIHAKIIAVNANALGREFLGKIIDPSLIKEFIQLGVHPFGEKGEYHTIVIDGPLFTRSLHFTENGQVLKSGYWFLDLI